MESKKYWRITDLGESKSIRLDQHHQNIKKRKKIGNYFETREEAEKAVKKLLALTRLKNNGFKFKCWRIVDLGADKYYFVITAESDGAIKDDLDLLFSEMKNE